MEEAGLAAERMGSGRGRFRPRNLLQNSARLSTLPLEGGGGYLKARSALPPAPTEIEEAGGGRKSMFLEVHGGLKEV